VRVRTEVLDRFLNAVGEVILSANQLRTAGQQMARTPELAAGFDRMERRVGELQRRALDLRTAPLLRVMEHLPRTARQVGEREGKRVAVDLVGAELELDRAILDRLSDPLLHLVRNAVSHGIEDPETRREAGKDETGRLVIEARGHKDAIWIEVRDDGAGIDIDRVRERAVEEGLLHPDLAEDLPPQEIAELVFRPGLSTARSVSEVSGRGVGMDAVKAAIESLGGSVEVRTERGSGTATGFAVPITAAVQRVLLLSLDGERVALPLSKVERLVELPPSAIEDAGGDAFTLLDDEPVLVLDLCERLGLGTGRATDPVVLVLTEVRNERVALRVDGLAGQQEIYVKPLPALLDGIKPLAGLTVLGDGTPVFLLDLNHVA
jgi:two-component system chemotaxis sensor kinase CheA